MKESQVLETRSDSIPRSFPRRYGRWISVLAVALFCLGHASVSSAQTWTNIWPVFQYVRSIAIDPVNQSNIYVGLETDSGYYPLTDVYKSSDGGKTWYNSSSGLPYDATGCKALAVDPNNPSTIYAALGQNGIYKSTNGGSTWTAINSGLPTPNNYDLWALSVDPQNSSTILAAEQYSGIYRSTNGGTTWTAVTGIPSGSSVAAIMHDPITPTTVYAGVYGAAAGVYKSTNDGVTWSASGSGIAASTDIRTIVINPQTTSTLYAAVDDVGGSPTGGVYISTNSGVSWTYKTIVSGTAIHGFAVDPVTPATLYAGNFGAGVYRSTDGGNTWAAFQNGETDPAVHGIVIALTNPLTVYAATCNTGVFSVQSGTGPTFTIAASPGSVAGGYQVTGTFALNNTSGGSATLTSSNTLVATVPPSVSIASGSSSSTFQINTVAVTTPTVVAITATYNGTPRAINILVTPAVNSVVFSPGSVVGGNSSTGTVSLTGPAPQNAVVALSSSNSTVASVPANVTITTGSSSANFTATTTTVSTTQSPTITATYNQSSANTTLTVTTNSSTVQVPASVTFGNQNVGTTSTSQPAIVTNAGGSSLAIASITLSGNFGQTNNCPASLGSGASCTINVTFSPQARGPLAGTITVTDNANGVSGSTQTISLTGTGLGSLTITASSGPLTYGAAVPAITPSYSGFINGDTAASLTTAPSCSTPTWSNSPPGSYSTSCTGAVDPYYNITYVNGSITMNPAPLVITGPSATVNRGSTFPTFSPTYSGFVLGQGAAALTTVPTCTTAATSSSAVGSYPITCSGAVDGNYSISYVNGSLTISAVPLVITASSASMSYGGTVPTITASYSGFVSGDTASSLTTKPTCSTTATIHSSVGSYPSSCSGAVDSNYSISYVNGSVSVGTVPLVISASSGSMTYGGTVPTISPSYGGFVNGDTAASLTTQATCSTTATTHTSVGSYPSSCSGAVDSNYSITYLNGSVTISAVPLVITASSASMTYGGTVPTITPSYGGFVNGDTAASLTTKPACSTTATTHSTIGSYPSSCSGTVDSNYNISYVNSSVAVSAAGLVVTASSPSMTYGGTVPTITPGYSGFVNGDTAASLTTQPTCSTTATTHSAVASYPSSCSGAVDSNYSISYVTGSVVVGPAGLVVTASSASMTYGGTVPTLTPSYSGFVNGDTVSSLSARPTCNTTATTHSPAGSYPSSCSGTVDSNYTISYVNGSVTVTAVPLVITASSGSMNYGGTVPTISPSYSGFANGDTAANLTTPPTCSTTATTHSAVASYPSSCAGVVDSNYTISYVNGSVGVSVVPLVITAGSAPMTYGGAVPTITAGYSGFVNGDTAASLTTKPTCSTTATTHSSVASYPSSCSAAVDGNYSISYAAGSVSVTAAPLVVTASSASMTYGGTVPTITPSYAGFVNGDTAASLTTPPTCSTTATTHSPVGSYPSSCSGAVDSNYSISYVAGTVADGLVSLVITAGSASMTYGGTVPTITPSYRGFVNGDTAASLTTQPTCSTTATTHSSAGSYSSTCSGAVDSSYSITYVNGAVTVSAVPLAITASSGSMTYGGTVPTITPSYSGFLNGDTPASLTTAPTCSTNATTTSSVGAYPSSCSGALDSNYTIAYAAGSVAVTKATATVTLANLVQTLTGSPLTPTATTNPTGLAITWSGAPDTNVGSYSVTATVNNPNYQGSASGTFTIVNPQTTNAAIFVGTDTTTQGNWHGAYGTDGYSIPNDSQSLPAYASFAAQNQHNYTWTTGGTDPRDLQTGSGSSRIASCWYQNPTFNFDVNITDGNTHPFALYLLDWDAIGRAETIQIVDATNGAVLDTRSISSFSNGVYVQWSLSGHVHINVTMTAGANAVVSGAFFGVNTAKNAGVATFVGTDTTTQGSWHGVYGTDGYSIPNDSQSLPAYASFALQNQSNNTWTTGGTDPRDLQTGSGASRIASCWYSFTTFSFDVNMTDGKTHPFALYLLDWDRIGRSESIQIVDATTGTVLDARTISNFSNGVYTQWNLSGHVHINVTMAAGVNAVVSGAFFGNNANNAGAASFVGLDSNTQGNWHGVYGTDGYSIPNDSQSLPSYATFAVQNEHNNTWTTGGTDPRDLQTGSDASRIASCWYMSPTFNFDVNITDGKAHPFALYLLDWDKIGRAETLQIVDANTGAVLDTRSISGFSNGVYVQWNLSGHVHINVTLTASVNAVVSGAFFGGGQ